MAVTPKYLLLVTWFQQETEHEIAEEVPKKAAMHPPPMCGHLAAGGLLRVGEMAHKSAYWQLHWYAMSLRAMGRKMTRQSLELKGK